VRAARVHIERSDEATLARQASLSAIPAPTGEERARGTRVAQMLADAGLDDVAIDEVGNVRGWFGKRETGNDCVVVAAHLDTVFGPELDVSVSRKGPRLEGPGIADNARGLAALITVGESLVRGSVRTKRPVLFAATVGEEGSGDLRGVRHLLGPSGRPAVRPSSFIALDGAGIERIVHRALGARRYHVTYAGPGGHSWAAYGVANPAHAVGRAIDLIAKLPTHHAPRTTHSVVRLGGGTSLNCIPQAAWFDVDLRSEDPRELERLDTAVHAVLHEALSEENRQRMPGSAPLTLEVRRVGDRPSGLTPRTHPLVQAAVAATRAVGHEHQLACASTDANVPISLGVPAVALGAGGRSGDAHLPTEWYENDKGALGIVRALLVTTAMAEAC
jgi:acetylornithine deacetylase/succinyl-diaminopimelate desuccinylase-like protein